jgi:hypothetical protein
MFYSTNELHTHELVLLDELKKSANELQKTND